MGKKVNEKKTNATEQIKNLQEQIKILKHINNENANLIKHDSTDPLTGLLNKDAFFRETKQLLAQHPSEQFIFIRYDIDKFQAINSLFGYDEGDRLLQYCAKEISITKTVIKECVVGRIDADIFCLCVRYDPAIDLTPSLEITENFLENFREDYRFNISVGVYLIQDTTEVMRDIYAKATLAARKCKDNSAVHYFIYDEETDKERTKQQLVSLEMHKSLKKKEFIPFFQPKIDLKSQKLVGAEALIRWKHPKKGLVPPSEFIPIFHQNGFISKLDLYVFESVCTTLKKWKKAGLSLVPISINMSQISMKDDDLPQKLFAIMKKHGIEKQYIHLEITEGSYSVDTEKSITCAKKLHDKGIHLEMDDFGTGISSLTMLHELPIDTLKLDLRFIKSYSESKSNAGIIHFIVSLARQMQLDLVAEGVETETQLSFLKNIGCDIGQGYLFSKAVCEKDFKKLLLSRESAYIVPDTVDIKLPIDMNDLWVPESNFNVLFNTIAGSAAIYEVTKDVTSVKVLKANDEYLETMQVKKSGQHHTFADLLQLIEGEDLLELQSSIAKTLQTKKSFSMTLRRINLPMQDTPKWLKMSMRFLFQTKASSLLLATLEDVTAQKERINYLEREAKIHEDYKKQLSIYKGAELSGLATMKVGDNLELIYANDAFLSMHGCTREYAFSNAKTILLDTVHPDDKDSVVKALMAVIKKKEDHFQWTMRIINLQDANSIKTTVHGKIRVEDKNIYADIIVRPFEESASVSTKTALTPNVSQCK